MTCLTKLIDYYILMNITVKGERDLNAVSDLFFKAVASVYNLLWGDLFYIPLPGGNSLRCGRCSHTAKADLFQAFGVLIDTIVICTCTAMVMLLAPAEKLAGLSGMPLLQIAMEHHFGYIGVVFTTITLWLFCFSTFIGILYYARSNVAYLFGDGWHSQTIYKILALVMLFIGGLATYTFVWDLGDIGVGLMTVFNMIVILPIGGEAIKSLNEYNELRKRGK